MARLLANTSILTAVANRSLPTANNKENNNNSNTNGTISNHGGGNNNKEQTGSSPSRSVTDRLPIGILVGINYKICSVDKVDTLAEESVPLIRLRCPYGRHGESTGQWSRDSTNWQTLVTSAERDRLAPDQLLDGEFYLAFNDFVQTFTGVECVHLDAETSRDEPTLQGKG